MVVEVMLLQMTVCMFPVELTVVKQLRNLSSGHLQTTFVEEPKTGAAAVVELSAPGRQEPPTFFLIDVISLTPSTGWQKTILEQCSLYEELLYLTLHMLSHISEDVVARIHLLSSLEKDNYVRLWCHQKLTSEALYCLKEKKIIHSFSFFFNL